MGERHAKFHIGNYTTIIVFVVMCIVAGIVSNKFYTINNITNVMRQAVPLGVCSLGVLLVIITGGIDLSVGSIIALGNISIALLIPTYGLALGIGGGVALCAAMGLVSGLLVTKGNITPFIATLGMLTIVRGVALILTRGQPVFIEDDAFIGFGSENWFIFPKPFVILMLFFILTLVLLRYTVFGRILIAIGSNETAARYAAMRVNLVKALAYVYCGLSCGIAAVILSARTGVGSPLVAEGFELDAISAVVVGGASLKGGRGTAINTLLGALIISMISNIMNLLNIPGYHQKIVKGLIIVIAVLAESLQNRKTNRA